MKNYKEHKDSILVDMTLLGDERAFEELVIRHEKSVKGTAYKTTGNTFSAEDAAQDAFVSAWLNLDKLAEREKFGAWVCSIAKNHAHNLARKYRNAASDISLTLLEEVDLSGSDESGLLELLSATSIGEAERDERLHEALASLSDKIREVIHLHYFEEKSIAEIAERLSLPAGTVKWRLSEGRRLLRKEYGIMEKEYNENEAIVERVMRQVEQLKLWSLKNDRSGFAADYEAVLGNVTALADSKEKSHALADVLLRGVWWLPGSKRNAEIRGEIKEHAIKGRNEYVLTSILFDESYLIEGMDAQIEHLRDTVIPWCRKNNFIMTEGAMKFWLARLILLRDKNASAEALACFESARDILPPSDVYYGLAEAALGLFGKYGYSPADGFMVTGLTFRYIDGKLCFYNQPGFGGDRKGFESDVFFYASRCDSIILDESLAPGESILSSDGKYRITLTSASESVPTPAGLFENCHIFKLEGPFRVVETAYCEGVGVVRQRLTSTTTYHEWLLSDYNVAGGGLLPLCAENEWSYVCPGDGDVKPIFDSHYKVASFDGKSAILAHYVICREMIYNRESFRGNILEAVSLLYRDSDPSLEAAVSLRRAAACAKTRTEHLYAEIGEQVVKNICENDESNPDYAEKSIRDCFEAEKVAVSNGKIYFTRLPNKHHEFEFGTWLPLRLTKESYPVMYNTPYSILNESAGALWSEKWVGGYSEKGKTAWGRFLGLDYHIEVSEEDCETRLGVFKNCRRVFVNVKGMPEGNYYRGGHKTYWFAPGIGIVKFTALHHKKTCISTWELTEYRGEGAQGEYFPVGDGLFRRYEAIDMHPDYRASVEYTYSAEGGETVIFRNAVGRMKREAYEAEKATNNEQK